MPRRKPYHPYRNIRLNRRPGNRPAAPVIPPPLFYQKSHQHSTSPGFALFVIICAFAMIVGGLVYMLTNNATDVELMKSLIQ